MMKENVKRVPELRFKGFTDDWEQRELSDLVKRIRSYPFSRDVETKEKTGYQYVHYGDIHTKVADIIEENNSLPFIKAGNYEFLEKGDIIVADASEDYQGIAIPAIILHNPSTKIIAGLHTIAFRPIDSDPLYFYYLFHSRTFRKFGYTIGTGMKVFGISVTNLMKFNASLPSFQEQAQIGKLIKSLDAIITLHKRKLENTKMIKKAMLEKMFPKNGVDKPEIRSAGFADAWEQCTVSDFSLETYGGGTPRTTVNEYWNGDIDWLQSSDITEHEVFNAVAKKHITSEGVQKSATKLIPANSIAIVTRVGVGKLAFIPKEYATSQDFLSLSKLKVNEQFGVYSLYKKLQSELHAVQGTSIKGITKEELLSKKIFAPEDKEEQAKIGNFFSTLDRTITFHRRKLDELHSLKQSYLQKMFI